MGAYWPKIGLKWDETPTGQIPDPVILSHTQGFWWPRWVPAYMDIPRYSPLLVWCLWFFFLGHVYMVPEAFIDRCPMFLASRCHHCSFSNFHSYKQGREFDRTTHWQMSAAFWNIASHLSEPSFLNLVCLKKKLYVNNTKLSCQVEMQPWPHHYPEVVFLLSRKSHISP